MDSVHSVDSVDLDLWLRLGLSLGMGLLIGMQREQQHHAAGVRTFAITALMGTLSGFVAREYGPAVLVAAVVSFAAMVAVSSYVRHVRAKQVDVGMTTDVALLLVLVLGAWIAHGPLMPAV